MAIKYILGCTVVADGKAYDAGTELAKLPKRYHDSCRRWCHQVGQSDSDDDAKAKAKAEADRIAAEEAAKNANPKKSDETNPPNPETDPAESDANPPAAETVVRTDLDRPIAELDLTDEIKELLAAEGVLTIGNALEFQETNKSFRVIKGIGKVSNQQILEAIEPDQADVAEPPAN